MHYIFFHSMIVIFIGVLSESTVLGLKHYASICPEFAETTRYVEFISNVWKIMSVKAPYKGICNSLLSFTSNYLI